MACKCRAFQVGQAGGGDAGAVVLAAVKEGVKQVGQVRDGALLFGDAQHGQIPLPQPVAPRRLLPARMAVQDVVIPLPRLALF